MAASFVGETKWQPTGNQLCNPSGRQVRKVAETCRGDWIRTSDFLLPKSFAESWFPQIVIDSPPRDFTNPLSTRVRQPSVTVNAYVVKYCKRMNIVDGEASPVPRMCAKANRALDKVEVAA